VIKRPAARTRADAEEIVAEAGTIRWARLRVAS
jgi:hypothetical protein